MTRNTRTASAVCPVITPGSRRRCAAPIPSTTPLWCSRVNSLCAPAATRRSRAWRTTTCSRACWRTAVGSRTYPIRWSRSEHHPTCTLVAQAPPSSRPSSPCSGTSSAMDSSVGASGSATLCCVAIPTVADPRPALCVPKALQLIAGVIRRSPADATSPEYDRQVRLGPAFVDVAVVIPMLDEATAIGDVVRDLRESFAKVICVDDGSSDDSLMVAVAAGAVVVRHPVNLGQGAALQTRHQLCTGGRKDPLRCDLRRRRPAPRLRCGSHGPDGSARPRRRCPWLAISRR